MSTEPGGIDPTEGLLHAGEDDLPYSDGAPMESEWHRAQMELLVAQLRWHYRDRRDVFVGGNMALYLYVPPERRPEFKAPDFFVCLDVPHRPGRKSWLVWKEGGRSPDLIIELLSASTEREDRGRKMRLYAAVRTPDYVLFDPLTGLLEAYRLDGEARVYRLLTPGADGRLPVRSLGLTLGMWQGDWRNDDRPWLRFYDDAGVVLPLPEEAARAVADLERVRADGAQARADRLEAQLRTLGVVPER